MPGGFLNPLDPDFFRPVHLGGNDDEAEEQLSLTDEAQVYEAAAFPDVAAYEAAYQQELEKEKRPPQRNLLEQVATGVARGLFVGVPELYGRAARQLGIPGAEQALEFSKRAEEEGRLKPSGGLAEQAVESFTQSMVARVPGMIAGAPFGPVGAFVGALATGSALYGIAEYDQFLEDARKAGVPEDEVKQWAALSGVTEGGLEAVSDLILGRIFALVGANKLAKEAADSLVARYFKTTAKTAAEEVPTEFAQGGLETYYRQQAGIPTRMSPLEAGVESAKVAALATPLFGGVGVGAQALAGRGRVSPEDAEAERIAAQYDERARRREKEEAARPPQAEVIEYEKALQKQLPSPAPGRPIPMGGPIEAEMVPEAEAINLPAPEGELRQERRQAAGAPTPAEVIEYEKAARGLLPSPQPGRVIPMGTRTEPSGPPIELPGPPTQRAETERPSQAEVIEYEKAAQRLLPPPSRPRNVIPMGTRHEPVIPRPEPPEPQAAPEAGPQQQAGPIVSPQSAPRGEGQAPTAPAPEPPGRIGVGAETRIFTPSHRDGLPARYAVVSAGEVVPSHDPITFRKKPDYPEGIQERVYHRDRAEQMKVIGNAQNLKPEFVISDNPDAINGPPIVTPSGIVLGGNSRAMTIARAYAQHPEKAEAYRQALIAQAERFGIDPRVVQGMERPVLVRIIDDSEVDGIEGAHRLASAFNRPMTQGMDERAETASLGRNVSTETISQIGQLVDARGETLRAVASGPDGPKILDMLINDGAVPANQRNSYINQTTGLLNKKGRELVDRVVFGRLIPDPDVLDSTPAGVLQKIGRVLSHMAKIEGAGGEWSLSNDLTQAILLGVSAKNRGNSIDQFTAQRSIGGTSYSPFQIALAKMLFEERTGTDMKKALAGYAADAMQGVSRQLTMMPKRTREESVEKWFAKWLKSPKKPRPAIRRASRGQQGKAEPQQPNRPGQPQAAADVAGLGQSRQVQSAISFATKHDPRFKTVASAFKEIEETGGTTWIGKEIGSSEDLAKAAQVWRNPRFEVFRIIYVKGGKVVGYEFLSAGRPGFAPTSFGANQEGWVDAIRQRVAALGADKVYLLHNHPSGRATPSASDKHLTRALASGIIGVGAGRKLLPVSVEHVVIDHGTYALIDSNGNVKEGLKVPGVTGADPLRLETPTLSIIGRRIGGNDDLLLISMLSEVSRLAGDPVILYVGPDLLINGVQVVSRDFFKGSYNEIRETLVDQSSAFGGTGAFLIWNEPSDLEAADKIVHMATTQKLLVAAVLNNQVFHAPDPNAAWNFGATRSRIALDTTAPAGAYDHLLDDLTLPPTYDLRENQAEYDHEMRASRIASWWDWLRGKQDVMVILQKRHGPQLGHWLRNMSGILSQTAQGREIYEAGRRFKEETIRNYEHWRRRYDQAVDDLSPIEKRAVLKILDTQEVIEGQSRVEKAAAAVRELLRDVRNYMVQNGHLVGYIEGYLPHIFQGKFWVRYKGNPSRKVETLAEALQIAKEIMAKDPEAKVRVEQDTFIPPTDATLLNRKSYWRLVKNLQDAVGASVPLFDDLTRDEIHEMLRGVARPKPPKRFFGNTVARLYNNPHFIKDLDEIMHLYLYGASRKVSQDRFMSRVQTNLERMPVEDQRLKRFIEQVYLPGILAHPTDFEEALAQVVNKFWPGQTGQDARRWLHNINLVQYVMDLGLSVSSAIANASQFLVNTYPIVGERSAVRGYRDALRTLRSEEMFREVEAMGITLGVNSTTGEILTAKGAGREFLRKLVFGEGMKGFSEATLMPFSGVEIVNRLATYWAGKDYALRQLKSGKASPSKLAGKVAPFTSSLAALAAEIENRRADPKKNAAWAKKTRELEEQFARQFAYELVEQTQFRVGRENLPQLLQSAPIRLLSPYKSYLLNQIKYTWDALSPKGIITDPAKALRFTAMTFALAGVAGNPLLLAIFEALRLAGKELFGVDVEKELKRRNLYRGLLGKIGADISGSVAVNLPTRPEDLLGRFGKLALDLGRLGYEKATGHGTIYTERRLKRTLQPAQVQRVLDALGILERGFYQTPIKGVRVDLDESPPVAAVKRALGMLPSGVARTFDEQQELRSMERRYKSLSADLTERWATAMASGDQEQADEVVARVVNEINESLDRLAAARTQDEAIEARTDLLFWVSWIKNREKFKEALLRKLAPAQLNQLRKLPSFLRPQAEAGLEVAE